jgi:uncharacterized ubiquitin-like protein YukD
MENTVVVTMKGKGFNPPRDLGLPTFIPVTTITSLLFKTLDIAREINANRISYAIENTDKIIRPQQTLGEAGVMMGDILVIQNFTPEKISEPALLSPSGDVFKLSGLTSLVGRSDERRGIVADVDLGSVDKELSVSRRHAQIYREGGDFWVRDLNSSNGTWINGERMNPELPQLIEHGDSIRFGDIELTFFVGEKSEHVASARKFKR